MRRLAFAALFSTAACASAVACGGAYAAEDDGLPLRNDASATDARVGDETLVEVVPDGAADGGGGRFCKSSSTHTLCEDFDDAPLGAQWSSKTEAFSGSMRIDDAAATSAPNALFVETRGDAGGAESFLSKKLAGPFTRAIAEADIRIDEKTTNATPTIGLIELAMNDGVSNWHFRLHAYASKTEIVEAHFGYPDGGSGYSFHSLGPALTTGQWTHVRLEVTARDDQVARGVVTIGTMTVFDQDLGEVWNAGGLELFTGAYALIWGGGADWKVRIDNVTLDAN